MKISTKLNKIKFSGIGEMVKLANKIGGDMVRMEIGDVDYSPPVCIKDALLKAVNEGYTHYPTFQGYDDLIESIIKKLEKENNLSESPDNILVTSGGSMALFIVLSTLINPGDEIIIPDPVWCHFPPMIELAGGIPQSVSLDSNNNLRLNIDELKSKITSKTKGILLNTPNNPTGAVMSRESCEEVSEIAKEHNLFIIADEEYEKFVYGNNKHTSIASMHDNTVTVQSFSKTYAMSGFRLGYIAANSELIKELGKMNLYSAMYASSISQRAALAAMSNGQDFVKSMVKEFENRMNVLVDGLNSIDGIECAKSQGSVYVWPNISKLGMSSIETAKFLIEKAKVVTVAGSEFGKNGEGYLRLSLGAPMSRIKEGIKRIKEAVENKI